MPKPSHPLASGARNLWRNNTKFRYLAIGGWNTLVGYAIFAALYLALEHFIGYLIIAALSHIIAVTQSFATQRWLVFRSSGNCLPEYIRFHIAHLGSLTIGLSALPLLVEEFSFSPLIAQGLVTVVLVIVSYFVHQYFTFRQKLNG